jgi:hypothetical protein
MRLNRFSMSVVTATLDVPNGLPFGSIASTDPERRKPLRNTRLKESPRERISVRNLAKELGVSPSNLLAEVRALGEFVTSNSSMLEAPVARKIRQAHGVDTRSQSVESAMESTFPQAQPTHVAPGEMGGGSRLPARRENHPYIDEVERPRDLVPYFQRRKYLDLPPAPPPLRDYTTSTTGESWGSTEFLVSASFESASWKLCGFSETERDVWMDAGLPSNGARLAQAVLSAGITPTDLGVLIEGATVVERLLEQAPVQAVKSALDLSRAREAG